MATTYEPITKKPLTPGKAIWALAMYRPWLYLLNFGLWTLFYVVPILSGLLIGAFFDTLTGQSNAGWDIWTLIALLAATQIVRLGVLYLGINAFSRFWFTIEAL